MNHQKGTNQNLNKENLCIFHNKTPMPTSPQIFQSSVNNIQSSLNSRLERFAIFCLGKYNYLNIRDVKYIFDRELKPDEFRSSKQQEVYRQSIQKNISTYVAVGAISSVGMNLVIQKIFPKFLSASSGKFILDLGIASLCVGTAMYLSLNAIEPDLAKIKKLYFEQKDINFIKYLRHQGQIYDVSMQNQIRRFLNKKQYDLWDATQGVQLLSLLQ